MCMYADFIVAGEDASSSVAATAAVAAEGVIPVHNPDAGTPSEVYSINDS